METKLSVEDVLARSWYNVVFQEAMNDQDLVIQGCLGCDPAGLWLEYCLEPDLNFRQAMMRASQVKALQAIFVLRQHVDASSLDDLFDLVGRYPNAIIEFATFTKPVGIYPHRRTVIFEVREY